ncbi:U8-agatoxin-Ao1a-like isoform X1 [Amphibalanus amphitrite]|uniref:U8-agatoxin-Ao1a-like isoform X1 n=1 Tax=Amphibalanus amphitrite TaxID=1232801 RepID=UPI001C8FFF34|nr:U8-agatoxin-Ao1a-like isoform X1 [Amphibalanus amphitrite]XP_043204687.1 U8-agatoxin-Ao1a-like isoform X1 [Amphibalanus amphitrite]
MRLVTLLLPLALLAIHSAGAAEPDPSYIDDVGGSEQEMPLEMDEYSNLLANLLRKSAQKRSPFVYVYRRSCIRRGNSCDARPHDCCGNGTCRCNLWGSNCKCMRGGLFQAWGRKRK